MQMAKTTKVLVGLWRNDVTRTPQSYEFNTWAEALTWAKEQHKHFRVLFHGEIPEVLPF